MKKAIFIVVILIFVFIINNLVHSIYSLWQKQDVLTEAQKELEAEKYENNRLKSEYKKVNEPEFIEGQARDKLLLVKPGEDMVIVERELIVGSNSGQKKPIRMEPHWVSWWKYFFE